MGLGTGATAAIIGGVSSIASAGIGAHAATSAADEQARSAQAALDFQKEQFATQQQNIAPWLSAGKQSLGMLMQDIQSGKFGPGSIAPPPAFGGQPTLQEARQSPGYQFELGQGISAIQRSAAARGGLGSGATLKSLQSFGTGLADTTYGDVFNRALATYGAGLQGYQAQLAGQSQAYNQLAGLAGTGQTAAQSINTTGTQVAQNVGNLMGQLGNAQAAGTVGSANAITGGIGGASNSLLQGLLLNAYGKNQAMNNYPAGQGYGGLNYGPSSSLAPALSDSTGGFGVPYDPAAWEEMGGTLG